jgi:hypothetical protein
MPESSICEICQKAEATVFICNLNIYIGEDGKTRGGERAMHKYCAECARKLGIKDESPK